MARSDLSLRHGQCFMSNGIIYTKLIIINIENLHGLVNVSLVLIQQANYQGSVARKDVCLGQGRIC